MQISKNVNNDVSKDPSIERVCLGTNMADSNRRQGKKVTWVKTKNLLLFKQPSSDFTSDRGIEKL